MQHGEFLGAVQHRARLQTLAQADSATRATLETLAERLAGGAAQNLAAQLDPETGRYLTGVKQTDGFPLDEFFERVCRREGEDVDLPRSVHHARAVVAVLREAVSEGAIEHVRAQLPDDFDPLFTSGSEGELRPLGRGALTAPAAPAALARPDERR